MSATSFEMSTPGSATVVVRLATDFPGKFGPDGTQDTPGKTTCKNGKTEAKTIRYS